MLKNEYTVDCLQQRRGIKKEKKENIITKLGPLMKPSRLKFYENLMSNDDVIDLISDS